MANEVKVSSDYVLNATYAEKTYVKDASGQIREKYDREVKSIFDIYSEIKNLYEYTGKPVHIVVKGLANVKESVTLYNSFKRAGAEMTKMEILSVEEVNPNTGNTRFQPEASFTIEKLPVLDKLLRPPSQRFMDKYLREPESQ